MSTETSKPLSTASPVPSPGIGHPRVEPLTGVAACQFLVELAVAGIAAYEILSASLRLL